LLAITVGGSLLLYALKAPSVRSESSFSLMSRESFLLVNNIILVVVCLTVLLGTLYPLFADAMGLGKISVGPPYFNTFFIPFMSILALLMGIGMISRWKSTKGSHLSKNLLLSAGLSIVAAIVLPYLYHDDLNWGGALGAGLMAWILLVCIKDLLNKVAHKKSKWSGLKGLSRSYYGMLLAHIGVGVTIVGIAMVSIYNEARDLRMDVGDRVTMGEYTFVFKGTTPVTGPNYVADRADIEVLKGGELYSQMHPEKRVYNAQRSMMTEAAIDPGLFRDLYVALGERLEGTAWAVRVQYKPFVRWIWLGSIFMALGGLLAVMDSRYRRKKQKAKKTDSPQQDQLAVA